VKKSSLTIPLLLVATVLTIVFGRRYAAERQEGMDENQLVAGEWSNEDDPSDDVSNNPSGATDNQETSEGQLEDYESRLDTLSIYERLDYLSLLNNQATLAFYGDIDLEEEWAVNLSD